MFDRVTLGHLNGSVQVERGLFGGTYLAPREVKYTVAQMFFKPMNLQENLLFAHDRLLVGP